MYIVSLLTKNGGTTTNLVLTCSVIKDMLQEAREIGITWLRSNPGGRVVFAEITEELRLTTPPVEVVPFKP